MSAPGRLKQEIVTIQFETKKGVKSPVFGGKHGKQEVDPFVLEAPEGQEIIGFFGSYGGGQNLLVRLGIYCQTVTTLAKLEPSNPQTPSNNEEVTHKEQSSSIKPETLTPSEPSNPQTPSNNEEVTPKGLFWIWWVKCILRYSPAGERVEGTTKTQRTQRLIDPV